MKSHKGSKPLSLGEVLMIQFRRAILHILYQLGIIGLSDRWKDKDEEAKLQKKGIALEEEDIEEEDMETQGFLPTAEIIRLVEEGKQIAMPAQEFSQFLVEAELRRLPFYMRAHLIFFDRVVVLTRFDAELNKDEDGNILL